MPTFKNLDKYFKYIKKISKNILDEIAEETRQELYNTVNKKLYDSYTPMLYARTYELLNSISKTEVKESSNGEYYVVIFYDTDKIFPQIRSPKEGFNAHATSEGIDISDQIPQMVEYNYPYGIYKNDKGINAMDDVKEWIEIEFNKIFKRKLKQRGIKTEK